MERMKMLDWCSTRSASRVMMVGLRSELDIVLLAPAMDGRRVRF